MFSGKLTDVFKTVTASKEYTVDAKKSIAVNFTYTVPSGYKAVGAVGFYTGGTYTIPLRMTSNRMDIYNLYDTALTVTATITVLFVKNI